MDFKNQNQNQNHDRIESIVLMPIYISIIIIDSDLGLCMIWPLARQQNIEAKSRPGVICIYVQIIILTIDF